MMAECAMDENGAECADQRSELENIDFSSVSSRLAWVSPNEEEFDLLTRKLRMLMEEGRGETLFDLGVGIDDSESGLTVDEMEASIATLKSIASTLDADCVLLREKKLENGMCVQFLVRQRASEEDFMEIRVAVVGNVDAGKSTLLGVLTHGALDNGRGLARQCLFRHKHEAESGRTSSVGNDILGFDSEGNVVNKPEHGSLDWIKICARSSKVITFIDLAGHEKYLKTTVFGMTGHAPDFGMLMASYLCVGSNAGVIGMTKEHLGLALALNVPVFVVVTKIDMCPPNVLQETLRLLQKILKSAGCRKVPVMVKNADDVVMSATNFVSERLCPIFQVSNVTGENLDLLKMFLNLLTTRMPSNDSDPAEFQIDDTYSVPGVGTVIKRNEIRKGMVIVSPKLNPVACWEFEGDILVLHHPTTISTRYQAMVHCGSVRQTASILKMSSDCLRTGDKASVHFRFIKHPEYLKPGQKLVFREGRTKAVGSVTKICPHAPASQPTTRTKPNKMVKQAAQAVANEGIQPLDSTVILAGATSETGQVKRSRRGGNRWQSNKPKDGTPPATAPAPVKQPLADQNAG
ncbi:unnamed protein product [Notodromas monacha]|uniref:Tr-type G domain-containing protein n=1 Tax=Notodromas monacha TaxID=399045 RepID=A0A7R9GGI6_9CRUS|nr:unnamed protein product [Notodromas monacha]CAG0921887.1 unnamed protein product [Notodromas monacha]